jgi:hypothetical protein
MAKFNSIHSPTSTLQLIKLLSSFKNLGPIYPRFQNLLHTVLKFNSNRSTILDWTLAITRNTEALTRIIAALYAFAGLAQGAAFLVLPRHVYRAVLRVLRPAESAVRRLIMIAAHGIVLKHGDGSLNSSIALKSNKRWRENLSKLSPKFLAFPLFDPLKRFSPFAQDAQDAFEFVNAHDVEKGAYKTASYPRISVPGVYEPAFVAPVVASPDDLIGAGNLSRRLEALMRALGNLNAQARRLARWKARRDISLRPNAVYKPGRMSPARPGSPPGARLQRRHEVDHVLRECHLLVLDLQAQPDTS